MARSGPASLFEPVDQGRHAVRSPARQDFDSTSLDANTSGLLLLSHDRAAKVQGWRFGGGVSIEVGTGTSVYAFINDTLWGENTHNANTITFGVSYGFQAFGGLTLGLRGD